MLPTDKAKRQYWLFLEALRQSGTTNMFGAAPYLAFVYGLKEDEATNILLEWMREYCTTDYDDEELPEV